jgi:hypothetical protein
MAEFKLTYGGQRRIETNPNTQMHDLLDALLASHNADSPVQVDVGQVRPRGDALVVIVSLSATADYSTLQTVRDELATALVDLGLEPDATSATDEIQITN